MIVRLLSSSGFSGNDCGGGYTLFHSPEQTSAGEKNYFKRIAVCKERGRERERVVIYSRFKINSNISRAFFKIYLSFRKYFLRFKSDSNDEQIFGEGKEKNNFRRK